MKLMRLFAKRLIEIDKKGFDEYGFYIRKRYMDLFL